MSTEISFAEANAPATDPKLRLTRRGRVVVGLLITVLIAGVLALVALFASPQAQASEDAVSSADFDYVVVQPGESLWSVATQLDSSIDPRDLVAEIVRLNQLDESGVQAGQPVAVPLRYADSPLTISAEELGL